ncbi:glycosyltransferase [Lacinutrix sp. C3R15]|uniref:glycosyltransferase n=1 Tax=Flavobacteriaceae TaxID=49546 RepID=UPI001C09FFD9|nr:MULTISPECIES: glycosyltransferase [Flavobacteriaceae]MBU2939570.1 glycosyltransferase [Lacinutrix sp. C3R15]MDO6622884.1 glycosyltransferase [Oceanihabitans sp. 1_MG-2023]
MAKALVSICMITYGHEKFIQQTIESVLMQQTSFDFEVIIANDCSPDATDTVVENLIKNHEKGNLITYYSHTKNKGMYANFMFVLDACKAKYIALCEGDDYWVDPLKLQKQVDFLEANPDYEVCFTNIKIVDNLNQVTKEALFKPSLTDVFTIHNLPNWAPTLTRVFKNRDFSSLPSAPGVDSVMLLWQSRLGNIKLLNEVTAAYRLHEGGVYSAINDAAKKAHMIQTLIVSLQLLPNNLMSKYFGKILKNLVLLRFLDKELYIINKKEVLLAYKSYGSKLSLVLRLKIRLALVLVSFPFITLFKHLEPIVLKVINRLLIY